MDKALTEKLIFYRRDFHKYPETAWTEFRTASLVAERLFRLGYTKLLLGRQIFYIPSIMGRPSKDIIDRHAKRTLDQGGLREWINKMEGYPGVVAILETGRPGPVVALRFDMDAVDVSETTNSSHIPVQEGFASVNPGAMHACGHDGHTAMGLVLAEILKREESTLKGTIKLIFQPAEEGVRGAKAMADRGILDDCSYFIALHLGMSNPTGKLTAGTHGFLCTTKFDVNFIGKASHAGAAPQDGKNALLAACSAALNLHAIAPHSRGMTRINVGVLQAGEGRNVIPPKALMKVETRGETEEIAAYVYSRAKDIIEGAAIMYGTEKTLQETGSATTTQSDGEIVDIIVDAARSMGTFAEIERDAAPGGSDDATWMMKRVQERGGKATYIILGSTLKAGHHNECFDFDETVLPMGVDLLYTVLRTLSKKQ